MFRGQDFRQGRSDKSKGSEKTTNKICGHRKSERIVAILEVISERRSTGQPYKGGPEGQRRKVADRIEASKGKGGR